MVEQSCHFFTYVDGTKLGDSHWYYWDNFDDDTLRFVDLEPWDVLDLSNLLLLCVIYGSFYVPNT
jgi:hypothetical protein